MGEGRGGEEGNYQFLFAKDTNNSHHVSDHSEITSIIKFQHLQKYFFSYFSQGKCRISTEDFEMLKKTPHTKEIKKEGRKEKREGRKEKAGNRKRKK